MSLVNEYVMKYAVHVVLAIDVGIVAGCSVYILEEV